VEKFERWTAQKGEFRECGGRISPRRIDALIVNKRGFEAEYRDEVKRLQAKIRELILENEIRKEVIWPFRSVEPALPGSLLDEDDPEP
jgi:hypothetical protein